jgi:hypothetical protein
MPKMGYVGKVDEAGILLSWGNGISGTRKIGEVEPGTGVVVVHIAAVWSAAPGGFGGWRCVAW